MVIPFNLRKGNSVSSPQLCTYDTHYGMLSNSFQKLLFMYTLILLNTSDVSDGPISGVPRNFVRGGGSNKFEDRERGSGGGSPYPLVRGSGGSCNLVQEISFHIV